MPAAGTSEGAAAVRPAAPVRKATRISRSRPLSRPDGWRSTARWSLFVALIPLGVFAFFFTDDQAERKRETIKQNPEIFGDTPENGAIREEVFERLPDHRLVGAFLPRKTSAQWIMAALSALIFWEFILIVQPMGNSTSKQLWALGIFTGTIGIFMLQIVSVAAIVSTVLTVRPSLLAPILLLLKFLGYSYVAAVHPENGFLLSFLGFTIGVGLLEELCKALPLFWHYRRSAILDVRGAVVWGLASGIGFGVSEGISYCESFYNGRAGGGIYVVRFISCVALHAAWSATSALLIWRRQDAIQAIGRGWGWIPQIFVTLSISMVFHGFYDTCAKKDYDVAALAAGMLSFALFFWLYDRMCRLERSGGRRAAVA